MFVSRKCHRYCPQLQKPHQIENAQQTETLTTIWWTVAKISFGQTAISEGRNPHIIGDSVTTSCQRPHEFTVDILNMFQFSSLADFRLWCFHAPTFPKCTPIVLVTVRGLYCCVCCWGNNSILVLYLQGLPIHETSLILIRELKQHFSYRQFYR